MLFGSEESLTVSGLVRILCGRLVRSAKSAVAENIQVANSEGKAAGHRPRLQRNGGRRNAYLLEHPLCKAPSFSMAGNGFAEGGVQHEVP